MTLLSHLLTQQLTFIVRIHYNLSMNQM